MSNEVDGANALLGVALAGMLCLVLFIVWLRA